MLFVGTSSLSYTQAIDLNIASDTIGIEVEDVSNPFDVNHIPIRKNQANIKTENLSFIDQLERHFPLISIIGLLTLLAAIVLSQRDLLGAILRALVRDYALSDFWRKESKGKSFNLLASYFFGIGSMALFLTLVIEMIPGYSNWQMYGLILCSVIGYFLVKHLILYILKQIYSISSQVGYYNAQIVVTNIVIGGALFFLSIFLSFGPDFIQYPLKIIGLILVIIGGVLQIGRVGTHFLSDMIKQPFPYFVYLCALEISPIMIIWSLISS